MTPFVSLAAIEQFTETPANRVRGQFSCLMTDVRVYGCYSADLVVWQMTHAPDSGRHPYAVAKHAPKERSVQ